MEELLVAVADTDQPFNAGILHSMFEGQQFTPLQAAALAPAPPRCKHSRRGGGGALYGYGSRSREHGPGAAAVECRASPSALGLEGQPILDMAVVSGSEGAVEPLLAHRTNPKQANRHGATALHNIAISPTRAFAEVGALEVPAVPAAWLESHAARIEAVHPP